MRHPTSQLQQTRQYGLTLIELLLAMTLGMGVILAATALLHSVKSSYLMLQEQALLQDSGRYALEVIAQALRQANFIPYDDPGFNTLDPASLEPGVIGLDNRRLSATSPGIASAQDNRANHGSDVLAVRFFGSRASPMFNCAGFVVNAPAAGTTAYLEAQRGWSIFYVAADSTGIPELRCKYATQAGGWNATAIVRGVEAFQVLYGIADSRDQLPQFLPAGQISQAQWSQLVAVHFALLIRSEYPGRDAGTSIYQLFGPGYANHGDGVVTIASHAQARKLRQIFRMIVRLRNPAT